MNELEFKEILQKGETLTVELKAGRKLQMQGKEFSLQLMN